MDQKLRSNLLGTVFAGTLALLVSGCGGLGADSEPGPNSGTDQARAGAGSIMRVADSTRLRGDLATAAALYARAHDAAPDEVEPLLRMGYTLNQAGATAEAGEAFRQALRIDPANFQALRGLGVAMLRRNQIDLAIEHFHSALEVKEDVRLYNALGIANDMKQDHRAAQAYYRVGLQVEPSNLSLRSNYGLSLALAGAHQEAIEVLSFLSSDPAAGPEHRQALATAYGLAGDAEAAAQTAGIDMSEAAVAESLKRYETMRNKTVGTQ